MCCVAFVYLSTRLWLISYMYGDFLNLDLTFRFVKSVIMQNDAGEFVDLYVPRKW